MALDREPIFQALFAKLQAIPGVVTCSRTWKHWDDVRPEEQPAIFLAPGNEECSPQRNSPTMWRLLPTVHIYFRRDGDPAAAPSIALHGLLMSVEAALERTAAERAQIGAMFLDTDVDAPGQATTLNGLVGHCWINGTVETDEGLLQNQGVAIVPLEIVTTS
jgi:hypothetical protein